MALTLWGERYSDVELRRVAEQLHDVIKEVPDVSEVTIAGGRRRQITVEIDPARLSSYGIDPLGVQRAILSANSRQRAGEIVTGGRSEIVEAGAWIDSVARLESVVVDARGGRSVWLRDVAAVRDEDGEPTSYVAHHTPDGRTFPAVTISIAKRKGVNAIDLTRRISAKLDTVRGVLVPADLQITVTRNYGDTAAHKSNELLWHMFLAVISVGILIWLTLGRREAAVVLVAIPVTLALTLLVFYLYGYTLNRITLFALIFSIGILVDDAIVVVENVVRHARLSTGENGAFSALIVKAVDEVGNPTILATLTVIAAILPMAFVGGLMGPYMRPIPVGATAAMVFSLIVAFVATPWASKRLLTEPAHHGHDQEDRLTVLYRRWMSRLIVSLRMRAIFLGSVAALLLGAVALVPLKLVTVKMLPFDNKSEFQVIINLPEGTPLEDTARVTAALARETLRLPSVTSVQSYVGSASPYNFNGLVRHYFLRRAPHQADLQVNLLPKEERSEQSHDIAKRVREALAPLAAQAGARIQVAEVPPGPPVLQTLVAEVYGPDPARRLEVARTVKDIFARTPGVVDVDWYVESPQPKITHRCRRAEGGGCRGGAGRDCVARAHGGRRRGRRDPARRAGQERRAHRAAAPEGRTRLARRHPGRPDRRRRAGVARGTGRRRPQRGAAEPISQEPAAGDLRARRCRRGVREPGLRDPPDERGPRQDPAARGLPLRSLQRRAALRQHEVRDEVGRRVAHHLRGLS